MNIDTYSLTPEVFRLPFFLNHHLLHPSSHFVHAVTHHCLHTFDVIGLIVTGREDRLARLEQLGGEMDVQRR
jgi:hypothetical protein